MFVTTNEGILYLCIFVAAISALATWTIGRILGEQRVVNEVERGHLQPPQYHRQLKTQKNLAGRITNALTEAGRSNMVKAMKVYNSGRDPNGSVYILIGYDNGNYHTIWVMRIYISSGLEIMSTSDYTNAPKWESTPATEENILLFLSKTTEFVRTFGSKP